MTSTPTDAHRECQAEQRAMVARITKLETEVKRQYELLHTLRAKIKAIEERPPTVECAHWAAPSHPLGFEPDRPSGFGPDRPSGFGPTRRSGFGSDPDRQPGFGSDRPSEFGSGRSRGVGRDGYHRLGLSTSRPSVRVNGVDKHGTGLGSAQIPAFEPTFAQLQKPIYAEYLP